MNTYIVHIEPLGDFYVNAGTNAEAHSKAWNSLTPAQRDEIDWSAVISAQPEETELWGADENAFTGSGPPTVAGFVAAAVAVGFVFNPTGLSGIS